MDEPAPLADDALWEAFSTRSLGHAQWDHRAHLRIAWMHLARFPLFEAHLRMRAGIVLLNSVHGLVESSARGYFETLTFAWLVLVAEARLGSTAATSLAFLEAHPALLARDAPLRFYSREALASPRARSVLVPPDREPFPALP
jgi:hypothetical protein